MRIVSQLDRPALVHAAELEDLLGTRARQLAGSSGSVLDIALANELRTALHLTIPSYELAKRLAAQLGYESQARALDRFHDDLFAVDTHLRDLLQRLLARHGLETAAVVHHVIDDDLDVL